MRMDSADGIFGLLFLALFFHFLATNSIIATLRDFGELASPRKAETVCQMGSCAIMSSEVRYEENPFG